MARTQSDTAPIYQAIESFTTTVAGVPVQVHAGQTVRAGHPLLQGRETLFRPLRVDFDTEARVEQATASPGEQRG